MIRVLGIDPGGTPGYGLIAVIDKKISPSNLGEIKTSSESKTKRLSELISEANIVVVEDFLLRPQKMQRDSLRWDSMDTSKEIGQVRTLCELQGRKFVLQPPSIKPVGYGWANQKYVPGKKGTHIQDALAHAVYYAVKNLGALPVLPS